MPEQATPKEVKSQYEKAQIAIDRKNYTYAINLLTHAINITPDFAKARQLLRLAEIKVLEQNPPNALKSAINRIVSYFQIFIAMLNELKGNCHDAIAIYENVLRSNPKNGFALLKLGILLKLEGMEEAAIVTLESAVEEAKKSAVGYGLLGELHSNMGNYERARQCFKKVIEIKHVDHAAERGLKNLDALTTIDKNYDKEKQSFKIREVTE